MYEINKLLHGQGACTEFSHSLFVSQNSLARCALARSISDTSPTRAKIPYAPPAHEVISMFYSTFYKTKLLSRILTLVNFSSERDKTLFSGGTRRKAWDTLPPPPDYFQINRRPPGIRTFLRSRHFTPPPLRQGPDDLGPLLSHLRFCLFRFPILYTFLPEKF